jgi:uncharacterized membrane protein YjgN (DUF898 family)
MENQIFVPAQLPNSNAPRDFGSEPKRTLNFRGEGGMLFGLLLLNGILTICTLGIYYFWGRARVRKFLYQHMELDGERFDYHGTGGELFLGFLKVFGVFFGLVLMMAAGMFLCQKMEVPKLSALFTLAFYGVMLYLMPYAIVGSQRYQRSRTSWRGLRFGFHGRTEQLSVPFIKGVLLTFVTLGFYSPYFMNTLYSFSLNHTRYGSQRFSYDGDGDGLFRPYVKAFFLGFVTFGLAWVWYAAERFRYLAAHTSFGSVRFQSSVTGGKLLGLIFTNVLLILFTGGLAMPWVIVRTLRFQFENLIISGTIDTAASLSQEQPGAMGDAMADALGIDTGIDAGFGL